MIIIFLELLSQVLAAPSQNFLDFGEVKCYGGYGREGYGGAVKECQSNLMRRCEEIKSKLKLKNIEVGISKLEGMAFINHNTYEDYMDDNLHVTGEAVCRIELVKISKSGAKLISKEINKDPNLKSQVVNIVDAGTVSCIEFMGRSSWDELRNSCLIKLKKDCDARKNQIKPSPKFNLGPANILNANFIQHNSFEDREQDSIHLTGEALCTFPKLYNKQ